MDQACCTICLDSFSHHARPIQLPCCRQLTCEACLDAALAICSDKCPHCRRRIVGYRRQGMLKVPPNPGELREMAQRMEQEAEAERREALAANEAFLARDLEAKAWLERARLARLGAETAASLAAGQGAEASGMAAARTARDRPQGGSTTRPARAGGRKRRRAAASRGRASAARGPTRGGASSPTAPAVPAASAVRRIDAYFGSGDSAMSGSASEEQVTPPRAWADGLGVSATPATAAATATHAPASGSDGPCSPRAQAPTRPPGDESPTGSLWFCAQCTYGNRTWWLRCAACDCPKREWTKVDQSAPTHTQGGGLAHT